MDLSASSFGETGAFLTTRGRLRLDERDRVRVHQGVVVRLTRKLGPRIMIRCCGRARPGDHLPTHATNSAPRLLDPSLLSGGGVSWTEGERNWRTSNVRANAISGEWQRQVNEVRLPSRPMSNAMELNAKTAEPARLQQAYDTVDWSHALRCAQCVAKRLVARRYVEDVSQDVMIELCQFLQRGEQVSSLAGLVTTMVRRRALHLMRYEQLRPMTLDTSDESVILVEPNCGRIQCYDRALTALNGAQRKYVARELRDNPDLKSCGIDTVAMDSAVAYLKTVSHLQGHES